MSKQAIAREIHKPARVNYPRRAVTIKGLRDLWQADLIEMIPYSKQNKGYKYILAVINTFSKFGYVEPLKNKTAKEVSGAFLRIIKRARFGAPKNLQTDQGTEFFNKIFSNLMKKQGINHYHTYSNLKASIVERWLRTLKSKIYLKFSIQGNYIWLQLLPKVVDQYNSSKHRTIRMKPKDVNEKNEKYILKNIYSYPTVSKEDVQNLSSLEVGDYVRISKQKAIFEKSYYPNWSCELFQIRLIQPTVPITYLLEDIDGNPIMGSFYKQEIQKTNITDTYLVEKILKKTKNKYLVKWLGFHEPSWIDKAAIVS